MSLDLTDMQRGLALAMERAKTASDEVSGVVRDEGRRMIFLFNGLVRMAALHEASNDAFTKPGKDLAALFDAFLELLGSVHIVFVESQVYVCDIRLRMNEQEQLAVDALIRDLDRHHIGGISLHRAVGPGALKALAFAIAGDAAAESPRGAISALLPDPGALQLMGSYHFRVGDDEAEVHKDMQAAIARGSQVLHGAVAGLAQGRYPNPLPLRRAVIDLVDSMKAGGDEGIGGALSASRAQVGEGHLLRVSNMALALGDRLSLPEGELANLGVAAMLHDIGYTLRGGKVGHGAAGLKILARQRGFHEGKVRRLLGVYQHHLPFDGAIRPGLFARILHIVDDYDVATVHRPGRPFPPSPARVLESMWARRGQDYDPDLLTLFIQMMGKYPPGTLLELDDGTWALSVSGGRDRERFAWPIIRKVRGPGGEMLDASEAVDLFEERHGMGAPWVLDPAEAKAEGQGALERAADAQARKKAAAPEGARAAPTEVGVPAEVGAPA